jgi:hypothetical protein
MPDMNAEFYSCCGSGVEISGYTVDAPGGQRGHRVHCRLCEQPFVVPGDMQAARDAIPAHFLATHQMRGSLDKPDVSQM